VTLKIFPALLAVFATTSLPTCADAQSVVILPNTDYSCQFIIDNMQQDADLRVFMANYSFGFASGLNAQRSILKQPVLDFAKIDKPMIITWSFQICSANPEYSYLTALVRMFQILLDQQQGQ